MVAACLTGTMGFLFFDGGRGNKTPLGLYLDKSRAATFQMKTNTNINLRTYCY